MAVCNNCGKEIRFIKTKGGETIVVNKRAVFFVPDDMGSVFVMANGKMQTGRIVSDGIKGFKRHECKERVM